MYKRQQQVIINNLLQLVQTSSPTLCCICMEKPCDVVIRPCGHARFCSECVALSRVNCDHCPLCRTNIESTVSYVAL